GRRATKLLPDKHTPEGGNHGSALPETIGNRKPRTAGGDEIAGHSDSPDHSPQNTHQMVCKAPTHIVGKPQWRTVDRPLHGDDVPDETADEHTHCKHKYRSIVAHLAGHGQCRVVVHRGGNETVEDTHQQTASH